MRIIVLVMLLSIIGITTTKAQQWQSVISLDSRIGYSTNSYLNPFLSEWDSGLESGYNFTSAIMQSYWHSNNNSLSLTGGILFEPVFSQNESWKGGLAVGDYQHRFSGKLSAGVETGASYFSSAYNRTIFWLQPKITWFASPFTLLRLKAGSNFMNYQNYTDGQSGSSRFDLYGLEFEIWPGYQWQLTAGLYGSLDTIPSIQEGFNARTSIGYHFNNGAAVSLNADLEQYQITTTTEQGGGGPPVGGGPISQPTTTTVTDTDRILRIGIDGTFPLNNRFSVFTSAEILRFHSETSGAVTNDFKISGGLRFSFDPGIGNSGRRVNPQWETDRDKQEVIVKYPGEGRLYLVGEFNNWDKTGIALRKQSGHTYVAQLELSPGAYEYKILVRQGNSEEWVEFSAETYTVTDGYGSENAILLVE